MHIVFFNRSYYPGPGATGRYLAQLSEHLASEGHEVSVVCGKNDRGPGKRLPLSVQVERRKRLRVVRVSCARLPKHFLPFRLMNLGTYFLGSLLALFWVPRPDLVVSLTDPPLLPLLAAVYARLMGARFAFAVNDLYPDVAVELGEMSSVFWQSLLKLATSVGFRYSDLVTVLGEDMKAKALRRGCPVGKIAVTPYWADADQVRPRKEHNEFRHEHGFGPSDFLVMYSGNLGLSQKLEDVLHVAREFGDHDDIQFVFIGEGANKSRLERLAEELGLDGKAWFFPYQPEDRLEQSLSAADLHLIPLAPGVAGSVVPCKMYGIMASGTAYLAAMDLESDVVRVAAEHRCGLWCPPSSRAALKERIAFAYANRDLLAEMGRNGRRVAEQVFCREKRIARYCRILTSSVRAGEASS